MSKKIVLKNAEINELIAKLNGWCLKDGKLFKQYQFASFAQAMGWMMSAVVVIEQLNHHPEWTNRYDRVSVTLITHDAGNTITHLDIELARKLDALWVLSQE